IVIGARTARVVVRTAAELGAPTRVSRERGHLNQQANRRPGPAQSFATTVVCDGHPARVLVVSFWSSMKKLITILSRKVPAAAALASIALILGLGTVIRGSVPAAFRIFRIPALATTFSDTITVTTSIDCLLSGQDPYVVRSFDPFQRVYNY